MTNCRQAIECVRAYQWLNINILHAAVSLYIYIYLFIYLVIFTYSGKIISLSRNFKMTKLTRMLVRIMYEHMYEHGHMYAHHALTMCRGNAPMMLPFSFGRVLKVNNYSRMRKSRLSGEELKTLKLSWVASTSHLLSTRKRILEWDGCAEMLPVLLLLPACSATLEHNARMVEPTYFDAHSAQLNS